MYSGTLFQFCFLRVQFLVLGKDQLRRNSSAKGSFAALPILRNTSYYLGGTGQL